MAITIPAAQLDKMIERIRKACSSDATDQTLHEGAQVCMALLELIHAELQRDVFDLILERLLPFAPAAAPPGFAPQIVGIKRGTDQ